MSSDPAFAILGVLDFQVDIDLGGRIHVDRAPVNLIVRRDQLDPVRPGGEGLLLRMAVGIFGAAAELAVLAGRFNTGTRQGFPDR